MNTGVSVTLPSVSVELSIEAIREEVFQLLYKSAVNRNQPLYALCEHLPAREWLEVENELERCGYLLREQLRWRNAIAL